VLAGLATFTILRRRQDPAKIERSSRFYGSHTTAAWQILGMIFLVILTLLLYRGAQINTGVFPFGDTWWAFARRSRPRCWRRSGHTANEVIETVMILGQIVVIMAFLVIITYSKHLHIALAPVNVATKRIPHGLGPLLPMESGGKPVNFEDPGEDDIFGRGKVEDFTWKGMLDFSTCTECGRCQSQCPAWNTGKPLSPKLVIMDLRDHLFAKAPYLIGGKEKPGAEVELAALLAESEHGHDVPEAGYPRVVGSGPAQALRPLVGTAEEGGVIDPDVLWSCTTCGACVEQCPVDIEHVDHIVDMRRYQVLVESNFPAEAGVMLRNLENKGNPWGAPPNTRADWTKGLDFAVPRVTDGGDFEYLFWVGCAGAFDDGAKKTTRAVATLLNEAGCRSPSSARARPAPATRPAGWATSSSTRCWPSRTSRRSTRRSASRRRSASSRPARTASTRWPTSTARSAATTPWCTTPAAGRPRGHRQAHSGPPDRRRCDLPRPVLPRPPQPRVRPAA
jgi:heterodisulfide reductase subunit C